MAELIKNDKGFKILKLKREETKKAEWGFDEFGNCFCSHCNNIIDPENIYYPVVIGDTMCAKCYIEWYKEAHSYYEDKGIEKRRMYVLNKLFDITD